MLDSDSLTYINEVCSCDEHKPRYDPTCFRCKSRLDKRRVTIEEEQAVIRQAILDLDKPVVPLVDAPVGWNPDGSLTLSPVVVKVLRRLMLERGSQLIQSNGIIALGDAIYLHQAISFEQWT